MASVPSSLCANISSTKPRKNQLTPITNHHLLVEAVGEPYKNPTTGATITVTNVATAVLLSAAAASFVRSLWIRFMRQGHPSHPFGKSALIVRAAPRLRTAAPLRRLETAPWLF